MRLLLCALVAALHSSCRPAADAPALTAREWRAWNLPAEGGSLPTPRSLAIGPRDELAALDTAGRVLIYSDAGTLLRQWKMLDVSVGKPEGLVVLRDGRVVVCDTHYHRIVVFDPSGVILKTWGQKGEGRSEFIYPVGICADSQENLYICEYGGHDRVQKFTPDGRWLAEFGSFGIGPEQFQRPSGLVWREGRIYVADGINNRVLIFTDTGKFIGQLGGPSGPIAFNLPYDIALGPDGALHVLEYGAGRFTRVSAAGKLLGRFGASGNREGEFGTPWGIAIDSQGRIYVADTKNRRIVAVRF